MYWRDAMRDVYVVCVCVCVCGVYAAAAADAMDDVGICGQTIVRRLRQADTHDASVNPFIETRADGSIVGHSPSSTTGGSASPKPLVLAGDVVIAGPGPTAEEQEPQRPEFVSAVRHALGLREEDLAVLRSTEPSSASPLVSSTLCAVSWVAVRDVCVG